MNLFHRILKHLPNTTLDPCGRIVVDTHGRIWTTDDTTLIILKGHLIVEAALADICQRLLKNPAALEAARIGFSQRLSFVRALIDDDEVPEPIWEALSDLNSIRNKLAHNLEPEDVDRYLGRFIRRLDDFEEFRSLHNESESVPQQLNSCILFLSGALSRVGMPAIAAIKG